jgi:hypothetical protein
MYLTYDDYTQMGGTLEYTAFVNLEFEAEALINYYTFDRLQSEIEIPEAVIRCMFKLVSLAQTKQQAFSLGQSENSNSSVSITSQSNDGVSISYNTISASEIFEKARDEFKLCIMQYLSGIRNSSGQRLLYRGLYKYE